MRINEYETKKVVRFKGISGNLETLRNSISKLILDDESYTIVTDLLAPSETFHEMTLEQYEVYLFNKFGIKNEIRASEINLTTEKGCVKVEITTKDQINKFISKLCNKYSVIASIVVNGYNEDDEYFENLTEVTDCYPDSTYESTLMSWDEYIYRYNPRYYWDEHLYAILTYGTENENYDEFRSNNNFLNDDDIKCIEENFGTFKK